ncbi:HlyD family efflux transporter periplasmic adaptor subunit [Muricauda sp. JGD-17]|uniref:HlyD family efflux transporter periplasmic adaptor subunit n=1 Tax=Flagellimonas ochracea TaxID=2696472 RepID=A0A964TCN1_9FLAO|nr:HlyD family efflux transporter periplasmic adaptor subunit [Allomuricauda ochracea]NAY92415.1 HlyD family efflux transporter periplasmic adaptor subunit [Allomuricauda ochracea]
MKYSPFYLSLLLLLVCCNTKKEKIYPETMPLTESVYASATVQPDSLYQVYSVVTGILDEVWVEEGDVVAKGDRILQITNTSPELSMKNAELALTLAKENYTGSAAILKGLEDEIQSAELTLKNDSINFFRQKNLWNQNIGSKVEFDNRKLAYELSQNKLNLLKRNYLRTKNELQTQLKQAENNYKTSMTLNKDFTLTSKINGKVYAIYKDPGEIINSMEPVAAIGRSDTFVIELLVDEVDIVKLKIGQKVLVTLDAYNSQVFEAKLNKIYPRKDERSQTFKVEALFNDAPSTLYPGLSGEGNIIIAQKEETLTIPKEYLIGESSVLTEDGEIPVTIGLQNLDRVEVLEGIDKNTALLKPEE